MFLKHKILTSGRASEATLPLMLQMSLLSPAIFRPLGNLFYQSLFPPLFWPGNPSLVPHLPLLPFQVLVSILILHLLIFPFQHPSLPTPRALSFLPRTRPSALSSWGQPCKATLLSQWTLRESSRCKEWGPLTSGGDSSSIPECFPCDVLSSPLLCPEKLPLPSLVSKQLFSSVKWS